MKKKSFLVGVLLLSGTLLLGGCAMVSGLVQSITTIGHVVCDNQAMADTVKAAAQVILGNAQSTVAQLEEEIAKAKQMEEGTYKIAALATLNPALTSAMGVVDAAYNLVYNVACPKLDMLDSLEAKQSVMHAKAAQAHATYRLMVKNSTKKK